MTESLIAKAWKYPVLRKQIPSMLERQRAKYFALRDKAEAERKRYIEMIDEYNHLLAQEVKEDVDRTV